MFQIKTKIINLPLNLPWMNDRWLMKVMEAEGYREVALIALNKVRCYQQVIFLLDILVASGRAVNIKYMRRRQGIRHGQCQYFHKKSHPRKTSDYENRYWQSWTLEQETNIDWSQ
jgi:hypothetical protein